MAAEFLGKTERTLFQKFKLGTLTNKRSAKTPQNRWEPQLGSQQSAAPAPQTPTPNSPAHTPQTAPTPQAPRVIPDQYSPTQQPHPPAQAEPRVQPQRLANGQSLDPFMRGPQPQPHTPVQRPDRNPNRPTRGALTQQTVATPVEGLLRVYGIKKSFKKRQVVQGVSLQVRRGESVGLLGPNGAGKTTVFYMVTGLIPADEGKITLNGMDVSHLPMYRRARLGIGYLPQEASIFRGLNVEENILAVLEVTERNRKKRMERLDELLEEFSITRLRKSPSIALSGGERRRVEIARALASDPDFMLLDEPFAGIDPIAVGDIQDLVRHLTKRGIGVLITDHNVRETLGLIDRAYIINAGTVLMHGRPEEVVADEDVRRIYLGEQFSL